MLSRKIYNILSGDKDLYKKTYIKYKYIHLFAKYLQRFLVVDFCVPVFYALKMVNFVPRSVKWTPKFGQKIKFLECLGDKRGTKLIFHKISSWDLQYCKIQIFNALRLFWCGIWRNDIKFIKALIINNINFYHVPMRNV